MVVEEAMVVVVAAMVAVVAAAMAVVVAVAGVFSMRNGDEEGHRSPQPVPVPASFG